MKDYFEPADILLKTDDKAEESLAMAYIPVQKFRDLYDATEGFTKGTIFKELDKPFEGWKVSK